MNKNQPRTEHNAEDGRQVKGSFHGTQAILKICLLGDGLVGKTSILRQFLGQKLQDSYRLSLGAELTSTNMVIDGLDYTCQIWDLAGQPRFSVVRAPYYKGSRGCLLVFDITRRETLENIPNWTREMLTNNKRRKFSVALIANKRDLRGTAEDEVTFEEGEEVAGQLSEWIGRHVPYVETSAKGDINVDRAFDTLIRGILEKPAK